MFIQACTLVANSMRATIEAFTNDVGQNTHKEVPRINANLVALLYNSTFASLYFQFAHQIKWIAK